MAKRRRKGRKHRTAAQKRATARMIAARRRSLRGKTHTKRPRRRARHASAAEAPRKRRRRRSKARRRRRNPAVAAAEAPRRRRRKRKASHRRRRRSNPLRKRRQVTLVSKRRKGRRRSRAVIRTRPRSSGRGTNVSIRLHGVTEAAEARRRRRRRHRRRNPLAVAEARHHHRRHRRHHRRHRRHNPISGMREFGMGVFGLALGGFIASTAYRFGVTHALAAGNRDAPAAGQVYNAEAQNPPIWRQGWKALAIAVGSVILPFGVSSWVKSSGAKSFWQLAGFGSLGFFGVKVLNDVAAKGVMSMTTPNATGLRLFAPEIMGTADLNAANVGALASIQAPTARTTGTAGIPRLGIGLAPGSTMRPANSAADCPPGSAFLDAGSDGKWCVTPPAPPPANPPSMPPPGGGPPPGGPPFPPPPPMTPPPVNPPGVCTLPPSPPSLSVPCPPSPPGTLTPPYGQSGTARGSCCGACASGNRCSCPINSSDGLFVDMDRA